MRQGVTIVEIAKRAGITPTAASRALRDAKDIGAETKQRVRQIAEALDYRPNEVARSLRKRRTRTLGLSVFQIENPFFGRLACATHQRIESLGCATLLAPLEAPLSEVVDFLHMRCVDGMIVTSTFLRAEDVALWQRLRASVPFVVLGNVNGLAVDSVTTNREAGTREAVRHLVSLGHREVGYVPLPKAPLTDAPGTRLAGFRAALAEASLPFRDEWMVEGKNSLSGARQAALDLLSRPRRPTAVFCHNDLCAWALLRVAYELGLSVPEDLSVMGFDNAEFSGHCRPALTTVEQPVEQLAETAVSLLMDRMAHPDAPPRQVVLEPRLIVRESTGRAPNQS
ncbi:MAG TPA: LacI family DNA-binding transcriptional regulator [Candidatus Brocadiia bacterium]|nr:LacI family DNA-binding transcriptional regulator [Candidatus Brocadiia bacterium]